MSGLGSFWSGRSSHIEVSPCPRKSDDRKGVTLKNLLVFLASWLARTCRSAGIVGYFLSAVLLLNIHGSRVPLSDEQYDKRLLILFLMLVTSTALCYFPSVIKVLFKIDLLDEHRQISFR